MEFLVGAGAAIPKSDSTAVRVHKSPIETCIARTTFRKLPTDIQLEYAKYYELPNAESLTSEEICAALFNERDRTSALEIEGHIRYPTANGVVVAKDVMDLVDWLAEEHTDGTSLGNMKMYTTEDTYLRIQDETEDEDDIPEEGYSTLFSDVQDSRDQVIEQPSPDDLYRVADDLERAHTRTKVAMDESREVIRDALAEIFILQGKLAEANSYNTEVVKTITGIVGMNSLQGIMERLDAATREGLLPCDIHQDTIQTETMPPRIPIRNATNGTQTAIPTPHPVLTGVCPSLGGHSHAVLGPSKKKVHESTQSPSTKVRLKRTRDDGEEGEEVKTGSSTSPDLHGFPHRHKKPRLERCQSADLSFANEYSMVQTILSYPSDDDSGTDSTYLDSGGTERDFIDDPYSFCGFRGQIPNAELWSSDKFSDSSEKADDSDSECQILWSSTEDEDCYSDPDYKPPDWSLEDIFELDEAAGGSKRIRAHPLYQYKYFDELLDCGGLMSDGDISTDDSDQGYNTQEMLQRPFRRYHPRSLGLLASRPHWDNYKWNGMGQLNDEETRAMLTDSFIDQLKHGSWRRVKSFLKHKPGYMELDVNQRLDDILASDHSHYYFDNVEWKYFVEPLPGITFRMDKWPYL